MKEKAIGIAKRFGKRTLIIGGAIAGLLLVSGLLGDKEEDEEIMVDVETPVTEENPSEE